MTPEQIQHAIEFLLEHHAKVSADIERNSEQIALHSEQIALHSEQIAQLTTSINALARQAESDRREIRDALENLIVGNEVTRDLAQKVAALQLQMGSQLVNVDQRVTNLESR
ncbi:MAG TPA: hypothetical protein VFV34_25775 [Blastocatellia bacterium]|nr:hypothetical protein [Blastocatellia bacterium]